MSKFLKIIILSCLSLSVSACWYNSGHKLDKENAKNMDKAVSKSAVQQSTYNNQRAADLGSARANALK